MTNFNSQNKANNIKGSKKFAPIIVSAVVTLAGAAALLTGCGNDVPVSSAPAALPAVTTSAAATVSAVTTSAPKVTIAENKAATAGTSAQAEQIAVKAANNASPIYAANTANAVPVSNISVNDDTNTNADPDNIGVDKETAIANVKELIGSDAQIISCEKGVSLEGFKCWEIIAAPAANDLGLPEKVTFYSGYQFCYSPEYTAILLNNNSTQNPMMNFIGTYTNGRAMMTVSCSGTDQVSVHISWAGSAFETSVWDMSGTACICNEGIAFHYDNCTKETFIYSEDGNLISDATEYTNGSGSIDFLSSDNNAYWYDAQEGAGSASSFWFCG